MDRTHPEIRRWRRPLSSSVALRDASLFESEQHAELLPLNPTCRTRAIGHVAISTMMPLVAGVGAVVSLLVGRKRRWVVAASVVLLVWAAVQILFTGRFLPGI